MQDIQGYIQSHFGLIYSSVEDPIFLLILSAGFVLGLYGGWATGIIAAGLFAGIRIGIIDWQQFVPGGEPSMSLVPIFLFTIAATLSAFLAGKFCRMVLFLSVRARR